MPSLFPWKSIPHFANFIEPPTILFSPILSHRIQSVGDTILFRPIRFAIHSDIPFEDQQKAFIPCEKDIIKVSSRRQDSGDSINSCKAPIQSSVDTIYFFSSLLFSSLLISSLIIFFIDIVFCLLLFPSLNSFEIPHNLSNLSSIYFIFVYFSRIFHPTSLSSQLSLSLISSLLFSSPTR